MLLRLLAAVMAVATAALVVFDGARSIADRGVLLTEVGGVWPAGARLSLPRLFDDGLEAVATSPLVIWSGLLTALLVLVSWAVESAAG